MGRHCHLKRKHWQRDNIKKIQSSRPILTNSTPLLGTAREIDYCRQLSGQRWLSKNIHLGTHYILRAQAVEGEGA